MKKLLALLAIIAILSSCGYNDNIPDKLWSTNPPRNSTPVVKYVTLPSETTEKPILNIQRISIDDFETISDEALMELHKAAGHSEDFIADYTTVNDNLPFSGLYNIMIPPTNTDLEVYSTDQSNYPCHYFFDNDKPIENNKIEKLYENDTYALYRNSYTEIRTYYENNVLIESHIDRDYRIVFIKTIEKSDNRYFYTGEMTAEAVKETFDIFYSRCTMLARGISEDEESFFYDSINLTEIKGDYGIKDEYVFSKVRLTINKTGGSFSIEPKLLSERTIIGEPVIVGDQ